MKPDWVARPIHRRAPVHGEIGLDGKVYRGGEYEPFYVPRDVMPQIDECYYPELFEFGKSRGVMFTPEYADPAHILVPHQRIDKLRAKHMGLEPELLAKRVLAAQDNFILDGNHRWLGHILDGSPVPIYRANLPFQQAIDFLFEFPHCYYYGDGVEHPISA